MSNLNSVFVIGNLTREVELRYTQKGTPVAQMTIAVNRKSGEHEEVCYLNVKAWGKTAENCSRHIGKGSSILVEGYLRQDTWEDSQTHKKRSSISIVAEKVHFINYTRNSSTQAQEPNPASSVASQDKPDPTLQSKSGKSTGPRFYGDPGASCAPDNSIESAPQEPPVDDDIPF